MAVFVKPCLDRHLSGLVATLCVVFFTFANEGSAQTANQAQLTREQAPSAFPSTVPSGPESGNVVAAPGDADIVVMAHDPRRSLSMAAATLSAVPAVAERFSLALTATVRSHLIMLAFTQT